VRRFIAAEIPARQRWRASAVRVFRDQSFGNDGQSKVADCGALVGFSVHDFSMTKGMAEVSKKNLDDDVHFVLDFNSYMSPDGGIQMV
jgi:hypothetical protein